MPSEVELRTAISLAMGDHALNMIAEQSDGLVFNAGVGRLEGIFKSQDEDGVQDFEVRIGLTEPAPHFGGRAIVVHMSGDDGWQVEMSVVIPATVLAAAMNGAEGRR